MAKGQKSERSVLYRAIKFELHPNDEQLRLLLLVSNALRETYNRALAERVVAYREYQLWREYGGPKPAMPTLFDQINALTALRASPADFAPPRNWQEETLDALDGAFKSFFALVKNGDRDARPPWERRLECACEIPGRSGFVLNDNELVLAPRVFGKHTLVFKIPEYCKQQLGRGQKVKKITLFRDEEWLSRPGRWWISLVYEIDKPEPLAFVQERAVYLAVGATWLGVVSPQGEQIIKLWRPDKHWKPKIDSLDSHMKSYQRGSRHWRRCNAAKRNMLRIMAAQQKQNQREVVRKLLKLGTHFVVEDLLIRGGLADASKKERRGALGLNWSVQNTGSIARLVSHLEEKVQEYGGFVVKRKPNTPPIPGRDGSNKIAMAKRLQADMAV